VTAWRGTAEFIHRFFGKGRVMVVDGRLQMRKWTDKDGNKRTSAEVVAENVYFGDTKTDSMASAPKEPVFTELNEDDGDGLPF
jgi:single-strand DNA-binding protein